MTTIGWDEINAYVDSELDAASAAEVAAAIARDPMLAARVATVARLKAATTALPQPQDAPSLPAGATRARPPARPAWGPPAIAAALVLSVVAGSAVWLTRGPSADPIVATVAAQREWLSGRTAEASGAGLQVAVAASKRESVPDLSAAELRLAYLVADPAAEGRGGVFAGYVGPNGCRLGLWIGRGDGPERALSARDAGPVRVRAWSDGRRSYALMSQSMDVERLARVTAAVADLTREGPGRDDRLRLALRTAARVGAPCVG